MNKQSPSKFYCTLLAIYLAAVGLPSTAGAAEILRPISIEYIVSLDSDKLGSATLGRTETALSKTATGYSVFSKTKAQGLAAIIIGSNEQQTCEFSVQQGRAVSSNYAGGRSDSSDYRVTFDWPGRKISFNDGDTLDMPNGYVVDNCNMPFAAALLGENGLNGETMYVIDGRKKRIRGYKLASSSFENLETILGTTKTLKIVLSREIKPDRTFTFWLSPENGYVPLKMEEKRRSRTTTMMVNKIDI